MSTLKVRIMGEDGILHGRGLPDLIPTGLTPGDPPPPLNPLLWYGTPVFGQSFARYKLPTLATEALRYAAVETDTAYPDVGGTMRYGSGLVRYYQDSLGTWSTTKFGYMTDDQPMIFSWGANQGLPNESTLKAACRTWLDSKPTNSARVWWLYWHEFDNDPVAISDWAQRCVWVREVLDEVAYASRTDIKFGWISTGVPWSKSTKATNPLHWSNILAAAATIRGGDDTFDFSGGDRYNPGWNGKSRYMPFSNWAVSMDAMHAATGMPMVIGETGSPRPVGFNTGQTIAQLDIERAAQLKDQYDHILARGYFDAVSLWRVPAVKGTLAEQLANEFSTIMSTPTGYNTTLAGAGFTGPTGGFDAQAVVDVHAQYCHQQMLAADPQIPFYIP